MFGCDGTALTPCHAAKARKLVKNRRARVRTKQPFSIQLNHTPNGHTNA
ncbi:RRXRR domain-containing protein (plasmid) [Methylomonas sp. MED-D]